MSSKELRGGKKINKKGGVFITCLYLHTIKQGKERFFLLLLELEVLET